MDWKRAMRMAAASSGLTLEGLASKARVSRSHLGTITAARPTKVRGRPFCPHLRTLIRLAEAADVPLSTLITWAEGEV